MPETDKVNAENIAAAVVGDLKPAIDAIFNEIKKPEPKAEPKQYTRADLDAAVAKGTIGQTQADAIWEAQTEERLTKKVRSEVLAEIESSQASNSTDTEIARYRELVPDLTDAKSEISQRCEAVYRRMIARKLPKGNATALAAVEQVCGPLDALEAAKTKGRRDTHEETGSGSGQRASDESSPVKGLNNRMREHYAGQIAKKVYSSWTDPNLVKEIEYIRERSKGVH